MHVPLYEPLLYGISAWAAHVNFFCNETILVQKVVYIQSNFAFIFLNKAFPHQLVTMQGKMLKLWNIYGP